jgi:2-keto-4-pentenoate hydratase/2-oxohepta-3-ene-1,7-dioic acid hydratase in catechol pathway/ABC-type Fe3+-siderophore transport system permease subunit
MNLVATPGPRRRPWRALLVLIVLWLAVLCLAPLLGSQRIAFSQAWGSDQVATTIFWQLRMPRVLLSLLAGAALAVSGMAFQTLFRNALAEPYTLGVASGASLGAVIALLLGGRGVENLPIPLVGLASFLGALGATALVFGLARRRSGIDTPTLLLAGIAVSLSCSAIILFLEYFADPTQTFRMLRWMMGGLAVVGYREVLWLLPWVVGSAALLFALRWDFNLLLTGEELAASRGVDLPRLRLMVLVATSLMIGALAAVLDRRRPVSRCLRPRRPDDHGSRRDPGRGADRTSRRSVLPLAAPAAAALSVPVESPRRGVAKQASHKRHSSGAAPVRKDPAMLLYRIAPEGFYAVAEAPGAALRLLHSDPLATAPDAWEFGRQLGSAPSALLAPLLPGKVLGIGRNYVEHAKEMQNPVPSEPLLFLKATSSLIGPQVPIVLPPESSRVEYEGEIAVVLRARLRRASAEEAAAAVLGVTAACDVTARDLQRKDATFARAKSFDTFCPLGPAIRIGPDLDALSVTTRLNGEQRQHATSAEMVFSIIDLLVYASRMMTLEPGDIVLTGTPGGVGPLAPGDQIEVEVSGVGVLRNPVEAWRGGASD